MPSIELMTKITVKSFVNAFDAEKAGSKVCVIRIVGIRPGSYQQRVTAESVGGRILTCIYTSVHCSHLLSHSQLAPDWAVACVLTDLRLYERTHDVCSQPDDGSHRL